MEINVIKVRESEWNKRMNRGVKRAKIGIIIHRWQCRQQQQQITNKKQQSRSNEWTDAHKRYGGDRMCGAKNREESKEMCVLSQNARDEEEKEKDWWTNVINECGEASPFPPAPPSLSRSIFPPRQSQTAESLIWFSFVKP